VTGALAEAGLHEQAEAVARSITDPGAQALVQVAETLAEAAKTRTASRVAAAACATGQWTTAAPVVLLINPAAFTMLARMLGIT
jgi:hypothetical protein